MVPYKCNGDWVLMELVPVTHASLIVRPDGGESSIRHGRVVAVGPGRYENGFQVPCQCKVGDIVRLGGAVPFIDIEAPDGSEWLLQRDCYIALVEA